MRNRYGDEYWFEQVDGNVYRLAGDLKYWRFGGKEGQDGVVFSDLGFCDPSGGPFIEVGMELRDLGKKVTHIEAFGNLDGKPTILLTVE